MYRIFDVNKVILCQNKILTFREFQNIFKVKDKSFASKVLFQFYQDIYLNSIDLKKEYINYYSVEYNDLEEFLLFKEGFYPDGIDINANHILLFKPETNLFEPVYDDNYLTFILDSIEKNYEN